VEDWRYDSLQREINLAHKRAGRLERHVCAMEEWQRRLPFRATLGITCGVGIGLAGAVIASAFRR